MTDAFLEYFVLKLFSHAVARKEVNLTPRLCLWMTQQFREAPCIRNHGTKLAFDEHSSTFSVIFAPCPSFLECVAAQKKKFISLNMKYLVFVV